ncbi:MAG: hypothetical protein AAF310_05640 [Myxococcota bacterium]
MQKGQVALVLGLLSILCACNNSSDSETPANNSSPANNEAVGGNEPLVQNLPENNLFDSSKKYKICSTEKTNHCLSSSGEACDVMHAVSSETGLWRIVYTSGERVSQNYYRIYSVSTKNALAYARHKNGPYEFLRLFPMGKPCNLNNYCACNYNLLIMLKNDKNKDENERKKYRIVDQDTQGDGLFMDVTDNSMDSENKYPVSIKYVPESNNSYRYTLWYIEEVMEEDPVSESNSN